MSFLIRVQLPDSPGSLGALAEAFGLVEANIQSVDIVDNAVDGTVIDDIVVSLPQGTMADALITAASSVPGVVVDSIRPFVGRVDRRGQIEMLAGLAGRSTGVAAALQGFVDALPASMTVSWGIILDQEEDAYRRIASSPAAPEEDGSSPTSIDVNAARLLHPAHERWIPESWSLMDTALAATPLAGTSMTLIVGRHGGPDFLATEVEHLGRLALIVGKLCS